MSKPIRLASLLVRCAIACAVACTIALGALSVSCAKTQEKTEEAKSKAAELTAAAKDQVADAKAAVVDKSRELANQAKEQGSAIEEAVTAKTEQLTADVLAQRDALVREFQHGLGKVDADIATLQSKAASATGATKKELETSLADLRTQRDAAHAKLTDLASQSGAAWDDLAKGLKAAEQNLEAAAARARARFH
ncbi:MAG: hypothetical protein ABI609_11520 [Acidobacteriota bacterium]